MIQPTNVIMLCMENCWSISLGYSFKKKKCLFNLIHVLLLFLDVSQILSECTALFTQSLPSTQWNERISNVGQSWVRVRPKKTKDFQDHLKVVF